MTNKSTNTNVGAFVGHCAGINTMKLRKQKQNKTTSFLESYHRKIVASLLLIVLLILFVGDFVGDFVGAFVGGCAGINTFRLLTKFRSFIRAMFGLI